MRSRDIAILQLVVATFACNGSSHERNVFRELAPRVNPALTDMRPTASAIRSARPNDYDHIVQMCERADAGLRVLRDLNVEVPTGTSIKRIAGELVDDRARYCRRDRSDWFKWCGDFCRERWLSLSKEVDVLRAEARKVGVDITSLAQ